MDVSQRLATAETTEATSRHARWRNGDAATLTAFPRFDYNLSRPGQSHYGWIYSGTEDIHRVCSTSEFYTALGFREEIRKTGQMLDEFLWERYRRDGAEKSAQCLQVQIAVYLHKHSARFRLEFADAYDEMIGRCTSDSLGSGDQHCVDCPKHPRFLY